MQPPPLACGVKGHVDRLLHVASSLFQDLAHLARHVMRELLFALYQDLAEAEEYLGARRRGRGLPFREGFARGVYSRPDVFGVRGGEEADDVARVRRITVLHHRATRRFDPPAADVIFVRFGFYPR